MAKDEPLRAEDAKTLALLHPNHEGLCRAYMAAWLATFAAFYTFEVLVWLPLRGAIFATWALIAIASINEAMQFPRLARSATLLEATKAILQAIGDMLLIPVYAYMPAEKPILGYQPTPFNKEVVANCPTLLSMKMTPWAQNVYIAFVALLSGDFAFVSHLKKVVRRELVPTPDGGAVALDWWEEDAKAARDAKRILFIGSTFTGDALANVTRTICRHFTARGWRCVVMVKRGCGMEMPNRQPAPEKGAQPAKPWCLMGTEDYKTVLNHVAETNPGIPICGLGLSAGAAQIRGYVSATGKESRLCAAVVVDSSKEWAIEDTEDRCPLISKALAASCHATYDDCHNPRPPPDPAHAGDGTVPGGLIQFIRDRMGPAHGFERTVEGARAYMRHAQPPSIENACVPVLEMVTMNDMLLTQEAALWVHNLYKVNPKVVTVLTRDGTHMVRWEGWWPQCWISRATEEFLDAVLKASAGKNGHAKEGKRNGSSKRKA